MAENHTRRRPNGGKKPTDAQSRKEARRAAREIVMGLLFETEFHGEETPEVICARSAEARPSELSPREERYIQATYMGIMENVAVIDALIGRHATGWRTGRLSRVSRAVLRLGVYELAFDEKIPAPIAINEAVELAKKFDDPKARGFVNGVLNAVKDELAETGGRLPEGLVSVAPAEMVADAGSAPAEMTVMTETAETTEIVSAEMTVMTETVEKTETAEVADITENLENTESEAEVADGASDVL